MPTMMIQLEIDQDLYPSLYAILQNLSVVRRRAECVRALATEALSNRSVLLRGEKASQVVDSEQLFPIDSPKPPRKANTERANSLPNLLQTDKRTQVIDSKGIPAITEPKNDLESTIPDAQNDQSNLTPAAQAALRILEQSGYGVS